MVRLTTIIDYWSVLKPRALLQAKQKEAQTLLLTKLPILGMARLVMILGPS